MHATLNAASRRSAALRGRVRIKNGILEYFVNDCTRLLVRDCCCSTVLTEARGTDTGDVALRLQHVALDEQRREQCVSFAKQYRAATAAASNKIMRAVFLVIFRTNCTRR